MMMRIYLPQLAALLMSACAVADVGSTPPDLSAVVAGNTEFGLALYQQVRGLPGNLFLSPHSLSTALAMTAAGARGRTAEDMAQTLRFRLPGERLHAGFAALNDRLQSVQQAGQIQLSVANSLWLQESFPLRDDFLALTKKYYGAAVQSVDFVRQTESARQTINAWVEKETRNKITELLKPGMVDELTRLVLCNAIYFKGNWAMQFDKQLTQPADFHLAADKVVRVPMMRQTDRQYRYKEFDGFRALELPYAGKAVSMVVLLPDTVDGLTALESRLTGSDLGRWLELLVAAAPAEIHVYLPKFTITSEFALGRVLAAMGMGSAFAANADFSGMTGAPNLCISEVAHKAFVEVNEEGTEAAAATAVVMRLTAVPAPPKEFRADHPFLFLIRENSTGAVLFMGRVVDPSR